MSISIKILILTISALSGCSNLFFYPDNDIRVTPKDLGLQYQTVPVVNTNGEKLTGWYLPAQQQPAKARILFLHGNAENISTHINSVYWLPKHGFDVLMAEYSGYGLSEGGANLAGVHEAASLFLNQLLSCKDCPPIIIYGQSLGASVAIWLAAKFKDNVQICKTVAESPFSDYQVMARDSLNNLSVFKYPLYPFSLLVDNSFSPNKYIKDIHGQLLLVHGTSDNIIPSQHSETLHQLKPDSTLWLVEGKGHLEIFRTEELRNQLLNQLL